MSFSNQVKLEIIENRPQRLRFKTAQAYGLFLFARRFCEQEISMQTESEEMAELYIWFVHQLAGRQIHVHRSARQRNGKLLHTVSLPQREDRTCLLQLVGHEEGKVNTVILPSVEHEQAFLTGAWLSCGNISDPEKSYHLEFVCRDASLCTPLQQLLDKQTGGTRLTTRRGAHVLYFKECATIEDLLTMMGASKSSLAMIEIEIIKNVRNKANRVTNCETANIDKLVSASSAQIEDIQYILERKGLEWLPDNLRQIALLRLENPDMSLRELAEHCPGSLSRSGAHHRLDKLSRMASNLRMESGDQEG